MSVMNSSRNWQDFSKYVVLIMIWTSCRRYKHTFHTFGFSLQNNNGGKQQPTKTQHLWSVIQSQPAAGHDDMFGQRVGMGAVGGSLLCTTGGHC